MKLSLLASLVAGASAFAPTQLGFSTSVALSATGKETFGNEIGVQPPLGFFDPAGMLDNSDSEYFDFLRWIELKHGRVAMLGVVGYLTTYAGVRFPGAEDIPAGFAALPAIPGMVWAQMIATWAMMEAANRDQTGNSEFKGDFRNGFIDFGWDKQSDQWKRKKRSIELNNGRAAQMGMLGLMVHDLMGNVNDILPFAN